MKKQLLFLLFAFGLVIAPTRAAEFNEIQEYKKDIIIASLNLLSFVSYIYHKSHGIVNHKSPFSGLMLIMIVSTFYLVQKQDNENSTNNRNNEIFKMIHKFLGLILLPTGINFLLDLQKKNKTLGYKINSLFTGIILILNSYRLNSHVAKIIDDLGQ